MAGKVRKMNKLRKNDMPTRYYSGQLSIPNKTAKTRKKVFNVADTEVGIMAVAKALNFGWSIVRKNDDESEKYSDYGITFDGKEYRTKYSQPVVVIANESLGYREVSGSMLSCREETVITYDDWDAEMQSGSTWTVDIYRLRTGMEDGWFLIQSSSSGAAVKAEKRGSAWRITLSMPIMDNGKATGHWYEAKFASAKTWYREQLKS